MNLQKEISISKIFFVGILKSLTKRAGSGAVSQRYRSEDTDSYQNVTDPEHWSGDPLAEDCSKMEVLQGFPVKCESYKGSSSIKCLTL
jgi:hypothetical protein